MHTDDCRRRTFPPGEKPLAKRGIKDDHLPGNSPDVAARLLCRRPPEFFFGARQMLTANPSRVL